MRVGQARKRDSAEKGIVQALRLLGAYVTPVSGAGAPDLIVRWQGRVFGLEVKSANGQRTQAQESSQWQIVRSVEDALRAIGVTR